MIQFSIACPPSVNELYAERRVRIAGKRNQRGRVKTAVYEAWERECLSA